jgi:hypothetical protein
MRSIFAFIFTVVVSFSSYADGKYAAIIQGVDGLFTKDEKIVLKAKLERARLFPTYRADIPGEIIKFGLNGVELGEALTDGDGIAELEVPAMKIGLYEFTASLPAESEFKSKEGIVVALVLSRESPIAISDIDHTISDASAFDVLIRSNSKLKPLKNAVKSIKYFSKKFQIVYLTARDDMFINKTKAWLELYGFVKGPSLFWDFANGDVPNDHGDFKSWVISSLKVKFDNVMIGFGDKPHDIRAYRNHGMRAYYIGKQDEDIHPSGIKAQTWMEIIEHFESNPLGSLSSDPVFR